MSFSEAAHSRDLEFVEHLLDAGGFFNVEFQTSFFSLLETSLVSQ